MPGASWSRSLIARVPKFEVAVGPVGATEWAPLWARLVADTTGAAAHPGCVNRRQWTHENGRSCPREGRGVHQHSGMALLTKDSGFFEDSFRTSEQTFALAVHSGSLMLS